MTDATAATRARSRPLVGVLLIVAATLTFAAADTLLKHLAMSQPVTVVGTVRFLVNLALLTLLLGPRLGANLWRVNRPVLVLVRGLCLTIASLSLGLALRSIPVGEAVSITYLAPFAVMLLAIPLLGERVSRVGWIGAVLGFLGVLLIVRPGGGLDPVGVAFALACAGGSTAYHLLTRYLTSFENTIALLFHSAIVGAVVFGSLSLGSLDGLVISAREFGLMVALGALYTLGHFVFTSAYREAPASMLAPVNYLHVFWAGGLGWLAFGHLPDAWSIAGMTLVCASGVLVALWAYAAKPAK